MAFHFDTAPYTPLLAQFPQNSHQSYGKGKRSRYAHNSLFSLRQSLINHSLPGAAPSTSAASTPNTFPAKSLSSGNVSHHRLARLTIACQECSPMDSSWSALVAAASTWGRFPFEINCGGGTLCTGLQWRIQSMTQMTGDHDNERTTLWLYGYHAMPVNDSSWLY